MRCSKLAKPEDYDAIVITNLCVPTASGVPLQLLPKEINGVRIVGIDVPGFGVPTHAEAKDVLSGAMLKYAAGEIRQGPVAAPRSPRSSLPTVTLLGEMFPADPVGIGRMLEPMGLAAGVRCRHANGANSSPPSTARRSRPSIPSTRPRSASFETAGRSVVGSAPVGYDGTADWLAAIGQACGIAADKVAAAQNAILPAIKRALAAKPIKGRITVSGYEGSELLVARLLIESGAEVPYVGTACPRTPWSDPDRGLARIAEV